LAKKGKRKTVQYDVELKLNHNKLQKSFLEYLQSNFGKMNAKRECSASGGNRIDIVQRTDSGDIFYEIKTFNNLSASLRAAIGQLFEYCFYPTVQNSIKLYLVSDIEPNPDTIDYIKHLNNFLNIPFGYIQFDADKKRIINRIEVENGN